MSLADTYPSISPWLARLLRFEEQPKRSNPRLRELLQRIDGALQSPSAPAAELTTLDCSRLAHLVSQAENVKVAPEVLAGCLLAAPAPAPATSPERAPSPAHPPASSSQLSVWVQAVNDVLCEQTGEERGCVRGRFRYLVVPFGREPDVAPDDGILFHLLCTWLESVPLLPQPSHPRQEALLRAAWAHLYMGWILPFRCLNTATTSVMEVRLCLAAGLSPEDACEFACSLLGCDDLGYSNGSSLDRLSSERFVRHGLQNFLACLQAKGALAPAHAP